MSDQTNSNQETQQAPPAVDPAQAAGGVFRQETTTATSAQPETTGKDALPEWAQKELEKARGEAAERRVKLKELETQLKDLQPLAEQYKQQQEAAKSEEQKLREQLEALKAAQQKAEADAVQARKEARLVQLAAKAGVSPDIAALLDISKLDLDDEAATLETLKRLASTRVSGGGASNPAGAQNGAPSDAELRQQIFGVGRSNKNLIFGGNK